MLKSLIILHLQTEYNETQWRNAHLKNTHRTKLTCEPTKNYKRRNVKAVNFGLIYEMQAFGLAKQLGIGRREAQAYGENWEKAN